MPSELRFLVLVGVPLLARWLGGRRTGSTSPDSYLSRELIRRHGLRPADLLPVERAAT